MKLSFRKIILTAIALSVITASACTEIGVTRAFSSDFTAWTRVTPESSAVRDSDFPS